MLLAAYSVPRVVGGDLMLFTWGVCTVIYLVCGLLRRKTRGKRGLLLAGFLLSEALVDLLCFPLFFPGGGYHNWGVGGAYVILLWPAVLLTAYTLTGVLGTGKV